MSGNQHQERRLIELQVIWLDRAVDENVYDPWDDRAGERVISPNRDVTITYWIDGEQHAGLWDEDDRGLWKHQFAAAVGSHIRFLVERDCSWRVQAVSYPPRRTTGQLPAS